MATKTRRPGAPKGNKNRQGKGTGQETPHINISMPQKTWEQFKSACDLHEGFVADDDEVYKDKWRGLCRGAVASFIKQNSGDDPEAIIL